MYDIIKIDCFFVIHQIFFNFLFSVLIYNNIYSYYFLPIKNSKAIFYF